MRARRAVVLALYPRSLPSSPSLGKGRLSSGRGLASCLPGAAGDLSI